MSKIKCTTWDGHPAVFAHAKHDGNFIRVVKRNNDLSITTSHPTEIVRKVPMRLKMNLMKYLPNDVVLLGELYVVGKPASKVKAYLAGNGDPRELEITYFACESMPVDAALEDVFAYVQSLHLRFSAFTRLSEGWSPDELLANARKLSHLSVEGVVLKDGNLLNWRKLKEVRTIDCVVTGFEEGEGKYLGQLGALKVSVWPDQSGPIESRALKEIANVSGMGDAERLEMTDSVIEQLELPDYTGWLVCEVEYQRVDSGGRLRHPRFVRWRDDKDPGECTSDQDPDLRRMIG